MAILSTTSLIWPNSVIALLRNFRLAGVLKKRFFTSIEVPSAEPCSTTSSTFAPRTLTTVPLTLPLTFVTSSTSETDAMHGSASPLNPIVTNDSRSPSDMILLVACLSKAIRASLLVIPSPSSTTVMESFPPSLIWMEILPAPASMAFSTSSFTTDDGLSTTSPAAILPASSGAMIRIFPCEGSVTCSNPSINGFPAFSPT